MYNDAAQTFLSQFMYELTPSLLNLYQDCARCFWVEIHENIKSPAGPSAFKSSMYLALKKYTDGYRAKGVLPPELKKQINGVFLPDQKLVGKWRDYKTGLRYENKQLGVRLTGFFDDCIVRKEGGERLFSPLDFKTRGFDISEENHDYHAQMKLDCYDLLLQKNGYQTTKSGYLVYYVPEAVKESGVVQFNVQVFQFVTESQRAMNMVKQLVDVLDGKIPKTGQDCEYCAWGDIGAHLMRGKNGLM